MIMDAMAGLPRRSGSRSIFALDLAFPTATTLITLPIARQPNAKVESA
ncbi:MAG: hypothetical protein AABX47_03375 [Nanoarchaeota archaeon]